jgi:hypothetical protein
MKLEVIMCNIEQITISIINWNKIIVGSAQRYSPMRGFGSFESAARFCHAFDELRQYFRFSSRRGKKLSLVQQRQLFCEQFAALQELIVAIPSLG